MPGYRWLWGENLAISSARFSVMVVSGWMSYAFTDSVLGSALVAFLGFAPPLLLAPAIGALADRMDKRSLIKAGAASGAMVSLAALVASVLGAFNLGMSLALALAAGLSFTLEAPARTSLVPGIVGEEAGLLSAYSWIRVASQGAEFVGPAITTVLLAAYGTSPALMALVLMYCLSLLQAFRIKIRAEVAGGKAPHGRPPEGGRLGFAGGLGYIRGEKTIGALILLVGLHCSLTMAFTGLLPAFSASSLGGGERVYGALLTAIGLGSIMCSVALARFARSVNEKQLLLATAVLSGATLSALALTGTPLLAYAAAFSVGGTQAMFMSLIQSSTQSLSRAEMRGRVAGVTFFFTGGVMGFSGLAQGFAALAVGPEAVMVTTGVLFVVLAAAMFAGLPVLRTGNR